MNIEEITDEDKIRTNIRNLRERETAFIQKDEGEVCVVAYNEGGYNCTSVPIKDIIEWVKEHLPKLL